MDGREVGMHRVLRPAGVLPQWAERLDPAWPVGPDEVGIAVERLNLDAASYTQLAAAHEGDGERIRRAVLEIVASRGKMHNPVTGSGGMLVGTVQQVGERSPLGLRVGQRVATLVSLTLTPLEITDGLAQWDGLGEQVPCRGRAVLFARSIASVLPDDLPEDLAMAVLDVCGAPALTARVVAQARARAGAAAGAGRADADPGVGLDRLDRRGPGPSVAVLGAGGKSGSLSLAAARANGAGRCVGVVPSEQEARALRAAGLADAVVVADARDPVAVAAAVQDALGAPAEVTVVCVTVPGCEHGAVLSTAPGGTIIFFSMATSFTAAALGAEGLAADVTMLIGNGYAPGHDRLALDLVRGDPALRELFDARLGRVHA